MNHHPPHSLHGPFCACILELSTILIRPGNKSGTSPLEITSNGTVANLHLLALTGCNMHSQILDGPHRQKHEPFGS